MTALAKTTTQPTGVPARTVAGIAVPVVSPWLREAMAHVADPHPDIGIEPAMIRTGVREEAAVAVIAMAPLFRHATPDEWAAFLRPLAALPNGPTRDAFPAKAAAIAFALHDVPASVLTTNRQRDALRALRFWPSPHDLDAVLRPAINALHRERRLLDAVATAPTVAKASAPSEAERERIAAGLGDLAAEMRAIATTSDPGRPRASHLSPAQLHAAYQRMPSPAAKARAATLATAIGDDA